MACTSQVMKTLRQRTKPTKRRVGDIQCCFKCEVCDSTWESWRQLSAHKWSKHRLKNDIRRFIGDTGVCQICHVDFRSRARLLKHLSERRLRAKNRNATCQDLRFKSNPDEIAEDVINVLVARDKTSTAAARKHGHRHVIAHIPCAKAPNILKRLVEITQVGVPTKRRRLNEKTRAAETMNERTATACHK